MPEGDSLHRLAARLAPILEGRELTSFVARRLPDATGRTLVGHRITKVHAKGKNLLIHFDDRRVLHIHLGMEGRVGIERPRSSFWAPERYTPDMRLAVHGTSIVGRHLTVLRLLTEAQANRAIASLGPDLVREEYDEADAVARARELADRVVADVLLVQRVVAGIGNVYKSEVLFLERIHPRTPLSLVTDDELRALFRRASALLRRNLGEGPRTTRPTLGGPRLWVYGRGGRPCLRCGAPVVRTVLGSGRARSTYFCPVCQPERRAPER